MKCLGGDRLRIRKVYVIEASAGVSLTRDGGVAIDQFGLYFVEESSKFAVKKLAY